jgi:FtsP/CotA-like multicopper oxidase with cupredoxin domain
MVLYNLYKDKSKGRFLYNISKIDRMLRQHKSVIRSLYVITVGVILMFATTAIYVTPKGQVANALPFIFSGPDKTPPTSASQGAIASSVQNYDMQKHCATDLSKRPNSIEYLTYFNCGRVSEKAGDANNGQQSKTIREFTLVAKENQSIPIADNGLKLNAWTYNGTVPGPTMRMTEGDMVKITVINSKENKHSHSLHLHSIHTGQMDGVEGPAGAIAPGQSYTYSFVAQPAGVYPYHCHVNPIAQHINNGLYGMMIIDPKVPRPHANEMAMLMNGYDLDLEKEGDMIAKIPTVSEVKAGLPEEKGHSNEVYTVNGKAFDYMNHPINLTTNTPYRIYLVNMLEFDLINSFHLHGNMFEYYPAGTGTNPVFKTDVVELGQGDRGIMEFDYKNPGRYMFHAHVTEFTDLGWMGFFDVKDKNRSAHQPLA